VPNERLWAPWRLAYVQSQGAAAGPEPVPKNLPPGADPKCFVCCAAADEEDRARRVVFRGTLCLAMLNRYPYVNGHLLVAPKQHVGRLGDLGPEVHLELSQTITRMVEALERTLRPHGFNVGLNLGQAAGAGLPGHLHWHVVPRWNGDTSFMPVVAGVNVIPQALEALWEMLTAELGSRPAASKQ